MLYQLPIISCLCYTSRHLLISACVLQQIIAEAHQHVTTELINHMIDEFSSAQAHPGTDNGEANRGRAIHLASAADGRPLAVHSALQHDEGGVVQLQTRKRKFQELPIRSSKWAKRSDSQDCMLLHSNCDVEMEDGESCFAT